MAEPQTIAPDKVEANWDALSSDPIMGDPNYKPAEAPKEDAINSDVIETDEQKAEKEAASKLESDNKIKEEKEASDKLALSAAAKELGLPETATKEEIEAAKKAPSDELKITLEDISDVPQTHPEGSFKAFAQKLGAEIEEDTVDSFKAKFIPKEEAEKIARVNKEALFASLSPEVAAALELKELGIPDELLLDPTKDIDNYLKLDDAELVRANLAATDGWTTEMIDTEIESLVDSGKISHEAGKVRIDLNHQKNNILAHKTELVSKHTAQRQEVAARQKEQEKTQFIETMNKVSTFMGVTIPPEVKETFIKKYNSGLYDKDLSSVDAKVNYILKQELEGKISKHIQNKASEKAKKEVTDKLLNIPPVVENGGGRVITNVQNDNWGAIETDFK